MLSAIEKQAGLQASWGSLAEFRETIRRYPAIINATEFLFSGTLLHAAAFSGSLETVKMLVEEGFDVNVRDLQHGETSLGYAAASGNPELVQFLLQKGAVLQTETSAQNPLFAAISAYTSVKGRKLPKEVFSDIVRILLDAGIDATVRYNSATMLDMDAMAFACMWGRYDIARMIAEHIHPGDAAAQSNALERAERAGRTTADHNDRVAKTQDHA
jgi:uncharacterized protein